MQSALIRDTCVTRRLRTPIERAGQRYLDRLGDGLTAGRDRNIELDRNMLPARRCDLEILRLLGGGIEDMGHDRPHVNGSVGKTPNRLQAGIEPRGSKGNDPADYLLSIDSRAAAAGRRNDRDSGLRTSGIVPAGGCGTHHGNQETPHTSLDSSTCETNELHIVLQEPCEY